MSVDSILLCRDLQYIQCTGMKVSVLKDGSRL